MSEHHHVIIVGAGPGGMSVAAALHDKQVPDVLVLEKGVVGQAWLDYPAETHLLSESTTEHDENMISDVKTSEIFPHMPHPSHILYQKYLQYVADQKEVKVKGNTEINDVIFDGENKKFILHAKDDTLFTCDVLVWAAGMYSTPNENMDCEGCYVHYARLPYMDEIDGGEITVVGSANGASSVVLELARPDRVISLVVSHNYTVPQPVDCLYKEQMQFVKDLQMQGLVKIVEHFRVKSIYKEDDHFVLESETGQKITSASRPIICTGFLLNIGPVHEMVEHLGGSSGQPAEMLDLDASHQSKKQPGLYFAGVIGKQKPEEGMIAQFRNFGEVIAASVGKVV